jgi:hypothetical protein
MDNAIQNVISLLISYWSGHGNLDVQIKNNSRRLTETIQRDFPAYKTTLIINDPKNNVEELTQILDQLYRTNPNCRQLINVLSVTANRNLPKSQSVNVLGNNNQVITIGGDMIGNPAVQNGIDLFSDTIVGQKQAGTTVSNESDFVRDKYENKVFVSYAWGGDSELIVDALQKALSNQEIEMIRDKDHLAYKGSIDEFEKRIGKGKCIVLVISDKYLRSKHCMYEFVKIWENHDLRERIFPIVLPDAHIFDANEKLRYVNYWDEQIDQLNNAIKNVKVIAYLTETEELNKFIQIRQNFSHLINLVSDMNVLTPEIHANNGFSIIISEIKSSMGK